MSSAQTETFKSAELCPQMYSLEYKNIYCYEFGVRPTYFLHRSKLKWTLLKFIYFYKVVSFLNSIFHITNSSNLRVLKKNKGRKTGHKASTKSGLKILQNKFKHVLRRNWSFLLGVNLAAALSSDIPNLNVCGEKGSKYWLNMRPCR